MFIPVTSVLLKDRWPFQPLMLVVPAQHEKLVKLMYVDQESVHDQVTIFQINETLLKTVGL